MGTRQAIAGLTQLTRSKARRVKADGSLEEIDSQSIRQGDVVEIRAGDKVPADGKILGFYAGNAEISGTRFLVIFRHVNDSICDALRQPFHPFCKAKISRVLQTNVVHLNFLKSCPLPALKHPYSHNNPAITEHRHFLSEGTGRHNHELFSPAVRRLSRSFYLLVRAKGGNYPLWFSSSSGTTTIVP